MRRGRRVRGVVLAIAVMTAAGAYLLFAEAIAVPPSSAAWFFVAYVLWTIGLNMLFSFMN